MLVIRRRAGESIVIGPSNTTVVVKIVSIEANGQEAELGITAPKSTRIDREEIHKLRQHRGGDQYRR